MADSHPPRTQHDLALERTTWARQRTLMAKQRTFAAWVRTGLSSMTVGFGIVKLLGDIEPRWLLVLMGCVLVFIGGLMQVIGYRGYYRTIKDLDAEGITGTPLWVLEVIAGGMLLSAMVMLTLMVFA